MSSDAIRKLIEEMRETLEMKDLGCDAEYFIKDWIDELESALAAESPPTIETCHRCSTPVPFRDQGQRFCHGCGAELSDPAVECSRCDWRGKRPSLPR